MHHQVSVAENIVHEYVKPQPPCTRCALEMAEICTFMLAHSLHAHTHTPKVIAHSLHEHPS